MMKENKNQNVFQKLPGPLSITISQIRSVYQTFYDKLSEYYNSNNFYKICSLLSPSDAKSVIFNFSYPIPNDNSDTLLSYIVSLLYEIITIYPVKYYKAQMLAIVFLNKFLTRNKQIKGVTLDWRKFHKIKNFYLSSTESHFISGRYITKGINQYLFTPIISLSTLILDLQNKLSIFFPDEIETKNNGLIIKTNTTEQQIKKFIPQISIDSKSVDSMIDLAFYLPLFKGRYKPIIEYFQSILHDTGIITNEYILYILKDIIMLNIEDDFSFLLPVVSYFLIKLIVFNFNSRIDHLADILVSLFISPPTRKGILDLLESFFTSLKSLCHPSKQKQASLYEFITNLVITLRKSLRKLAKKKENKRFFNMNENFGPSQEEIHKLLSMTSEINIMNIRQSFDLNLVITETILDPLTIDHYFEIAFQCINLTNANVIASNGWTIMTALILSIDKNEKIKENFESIFIIATNNLVNVQLQVKILEFLLTCFIKIPFNKEKTVKGLENLDFCELANSYFSNFFDAIKALKDKNGRAIFEKKFGASSILSIEILFRNCSSEVFDELIPILTHLAFDETIYFCYKLINLTVAYFYYYANNEQAEKVINAFKSRIDLSTSNRNIFNYLARVFSNATMNQQKI